VQIQPVERDAAPQALRGELSARGRFPLWSLAVILAAGLGLLCGAFYMLSVWPASTTQEPLRDAFLTQAAGATQAVQAASTQTVAVNQTAAVSQGQLDTDGDGLIDGEEVRLGSDPTNPTAIRMKSSTAMKFVTMPQTRSTRIAMRMGCRMAMKSCAV
jgi:hypothetical protein